MHTTFTRPTNSDGLFWVAMHYVNGNAALMRTGQLSTVITPDTSPNPEWRRISKLSGFTSYTLETKLYGPYSDAGAMQIVADFLFVTEQPVCNVKHSGDAATANAPRKVVCRETCRIFASRNQCATYYRLDPAALGRHLNKKTGFRSVKGKVFAFYDELSPDEQQFVDKKNAELT